MRTGTRPRRKTAGKAICRLSGDDPVSLPHRFNESLKYEHLYREEIADAVALTEEVEAYRKIYNEIRPHEALRCRTPLAVHLAEPNLFETQSVQKS
ncbi:MAG TPA: integrase core domain-containing protein [Actinomycetota bacterium]|nr:integrase core domain-containing protein [Actinomycetota bacterium]